MVERKLESVVLREMRIKKKRDELHPEQREKLHQFCKTWVDVLSDLDMLIDG